MEGIQPSVDQKCQEAKSLRGTTDQKEIYINRLRAERSGYPREQGKSKQEQFYREDKKSHKVCLCLGPGGTTTIGSSLGRGSGATIFTAAGAAATEAAGDQK